MKIYFDATVLGKEQGLGANYKAIYDTIEKLGHKNLSSTVLDMNAQSLFTQTNKEASDSYHKVIKTIKEADLVIFELSHSTLGMGYLAATVLQFGKPLIALHLPKKDLYILRGMESEKVTLAEYTMDTLEQVLKEAIAFASDSMDTRFNFFVPPHISHYLDWITKYKKLPRAVYLRELIEEHMRQNKEYQNGDK
jgi:hypothetical protein